MIKEEIIIEVTEIGVEKATKNAKELAAATQSVSDTTTGMAGSMKNSAGSVLDNGGAMGLLNDATGGYAMTVKDAVEASVLFTKSQKAAALAQSAYNLIVGTSTGALKLFRIALVSTGIGAIIVGLGLLIANFDKVKKAVLNLVPGLAVIGDIFNSLVEMVTDFIGVTSDATRALDKMVADAEASLKRNEHFLEANGDKYDQYTQRKLKANIDYNKKVKELAADEELTEEEKLSRLKDFRDKANREIIKADEDRAAELSKKREEESLKIKEANDKLAEEAKKRIEEQRKREEEERLRQQKIREEANALQGKAFENDLEATVNAQIAKDEALAALKEESDLQKLEKQREYDLAVLEQANATAEEILALNLSYDERADLFKTEAINKQKELQKAAQDEDLKNSEAVANAKVQIAGQALNLIGSLAKEGSAVAKGVAVAQATIDTYKGAVSAYSAMSGIPIVGPALGAVSAGIVVAAGLLNIKKILATKPVEKSAPSGGAAIPQPPPSFNLVQGTGANQIASAIGGQNQPIQAYVVGSNVTSQQSMDRNIVDNSTL